MAQIIRFPNKENQNLVELLEDILHAAKAGEFKNFAFAAIDSKNECVHTAYYNVDVAEKQYLASHIQTDAMYDVVRVNLFDE